MILEKLIGLLGLGLLSLLISCASFTTPCYYDMNDYTCAGYQHSLHPDKEQFIIDRMRVNDDYGCGEKPSCATQGYEKSQTIDGVRTLRSFK